MAELLLMLELPLKLIEQSAHWHALQFDWQA